MKRPDRASVRRDLLSLTSTLDEVLRAMFLYSADFMLIRSGSSERMLRKEHIVSVMRGSEELTIEDTIDGDSRDALSSKPQLDDAPQSEPVLLLTRTGSGTECDLELTTFGEFREQKQRENTVIMPEWWTIPLPLVYIDSDRVLLNSAAGGEVPGGAVAMARQVDKMRSDRIVTLRDGARERTFSLAPLGENTYLIEDISGDFEMAEDLVWWAALGRALVSRMETGGIGVERLSPFEEPPSDADEVIECKWENSLVGRLVIRVPGGDSSTEAVIERDAAPVPAAGASEAPAAQEAEPESSAPLRISAAINAYGMKETAGPAEPQPGQSVGSAAPAVNQPAATAPAGAGAPRQPEAKPVSRPVPAPQDTARSAQASASKPAIADQTAPRQAATPQTRPDQPKAPAAAATPAETAAKEQPRQPKPAQPKPAEQPAAAQAHPAAQTKPAQQAQQTSQAQPVAQAKPSVQTKASGQGTVASGSTAAPQAAQRPPSAAAAPAAYAGQGARPSPQTAKPAAQPSQAQPQTAQKQQQAQAQPQKSATVSAAGAVNAGPVKTAQPAAHTAPARTTAEATRGAAGEQQAKQPEAAKQTAAPPAEQSAAAKEEKPKEVNAAPAGQQAAAAAQVMPPKQEGGGSAFPRPGLTEKHVLGRATEADREAKGGSAGQGEGEKAGVPRADSPPSQERPAIHPKMLLCETVLSEGAVDGGEPVDLEP